MTKDVKLTIKKDRLIFNEYLKNDLNVILRYNSSFGIGEECILFISSLLNHWKGEWSVFNIRFNVKKEDLVIYRNRVIWNYNESSIVILNNHMSFFLKTYKESDIPDQRCYKFNLKVWKPIGTMDIRKVKLIKILDL